MCVQNIENLLSYELSEQWSCEIYSVKFNRLNGGVLISTAICPSLRVPPLHVIIIYICTASLRKSGGWRRVFHLCNACTFVFNTCSGVVGWQQARAGTVGPNSILTGPKVQHLRSPYRLDISRRENVVVHGVQKFRKITFYLNCLLSARIVGRTKVKNITTT